jgi:hypothetical protein
MSHHEGSGNDRVVTLGQLMEAYLHPRVLRLTERVEIEEHTQFKRRKSWIINTFLANCVMFWSAIVQLIIWLTG